MEYEAVSEKLVYLPRSHAWSIYGAFLTTELPALKKRSHGMLSYFDHRQSYL